MLCRPFVRTLVASSLVVLAAACDGGADGGGSGGSGASMSDGGGGGSNTTSVSVTGGAGGGGAGGGGAGGVPVETALVHRVGRFDESDPARPRSSWSGTTLRTRVSGAAVSVKLGGASNVHFQVEIDGQAGGTLVTAGGDQTYEIANGLASGEHDIALVRRNEGFFGDVDFLGFEAGPGASLVESPWPFVHSLELIGDSLTAGYGIEGGSANCSFSAGTESFYGTYGAVAGRNTGAAVHAIAYSGKGVFQNYGGDQNELMPELWLRTLTNDGASAWDFSKWTPEAVVINLGTNDFSAPVAEGSFVGAYAGLIGAVRERYPSAMIFCVTWAHWGQAKEAWVEAAMAQTGDPDLRHVAFSIDPADGYGCDYHTNLVTNQKLGQILTQALKDELGW